MPVSELAARAGVKSSTIRFYERRGVLAEPGRTPGGYRDYDESDLRRLRFLLNGQRLGFTLAELAELLELSERARGAALPIGELAAVGDRKLDEIDDRIAGLRRTRDALSELLAGQGPDPAAPCPIIAAIADD